MPIADALPVHLTDAYSEASTALKEGKSVLLIGSPVSGCTLLARKLGANLRVPIPKGFARDMALVYRLDGLTEAVPDELRRPFRAPHHTVSMAGLRGSILGDRPGEMSLAHGGTLYLDDVIEFSRKALEAVYRAHLRRVVACRGPWIVALPADFALIASVCPCPCGFRDEARCKCSEKMRDAYDARLASLRFDVRITLPGTDRWKELRVCPSM